MSANDPKRTRRNLLDHLVGAGEDRWGDREAINQCTLWIAWAARQPTSLFDNPVRSKVDRLSALAPSNGPKKEWPPPSCA